MKHYLSMALNMALHFAKQNTAHGRVINILSGLELYMQSDFLHFAYVNLTPFEYAKK